MTLAHAPKPKGAARPTTAAPTRASEARAGTEAGQEPSWPLFLLGRASAASPPAVQHACACGGSCASCKAAEEERAVQASADASLGPSPSVHHAAASGIAEANAPLPHLDSIQRAFGRHDVSGARAHVGGRASDANRAMGSRAYTVGDRVGFASAPDLHLAAHEAAHVVQQRRGVALKGGVGQPGDAYERQADRAADAVVRGESAESILGAPIVGGSALGGAVQHRLEATATRRYEPPPALLPPIASPAARAEPEAEEGAAREEAPAEGGGEDAEAEAPAEGEAEGGDGGAAETAEPACEGAGSLNAHRYDADIEEPSEDEEPEGTPPEPEAGDAEENISADSPEAETIDDCPAADAATEATEGGGVATRSSEGTGGAGGGAGPEATPNGGGASEAEGGGASEAEGGGEREAEGGGEREAEGEGASGGGGAVAPAEDPLAAGIAGVEAARAASIESYGVSGAKLGGARAQVDGLEAGGALFRPDGDDAKVNAANALAGAFFGHAAERLTAAIDLAEIEAPERLGSLTSALSLAIDGAIEAEKGRISARIAQARGQVIAQAAQAEVMTTVGWITSVAAIEVETTTARTAIQEAHTDAILAIDDREQTALSDVNEAYETSRDNHAALGPLIGDEAVARGEEYASAYHQFRINRKDSFWSGYLTDRRAEAQKNAARETASGYRRSMVETADRQAGEVGRGRRQDRCAVIAMASAARATLDAQLTALEGALDQGREAALAQATATRDELLTQIASARVSSLNQLAEQEHRQRQAANDTGYLQQVTLEAAAFSHAASLAETVASATGLVTAGLGALRETFATRTPPEPAELQRVLEGATGGLDGGIGRLVGSVTGALVAAEAQLLATGAAAIGAVTGVGDANDEQAGGLELGFVGLFSGLARAATTTFAGQSAAYRTETRAAVERGTSTLAAGVTGFDTACVDHLGRVTRGLGDSETALERSLRGSLGQMDCESSGIPKQAREAASHEQPAWKSVVAWVLIIAIIIVVAVVAGPAVIGAVGAAASTLGASAGAATLIGTVVGGAIVGAATSATIQVVNNWASGQELLRGVGRAALVGAIGGAIGAAMGAGVNAVVARIGERVVLSAAQRVVTQLALNVASDTVQALGEQLITGEFSWQGLGMAVLMSAATGGFGEIPRVSRIQRGWMARGAGVVPGARAQAFAAHLRPPDAPAAGPRTEAPGEARPVGEGPRTDAAPESGPRAGAPDEAGTGPRGTSDAEVSGAPRAEPTGAEPGGAPRAEPGGAPRAEPGGAPRVGAEPDVRPGDARPLREQPDVPARDRSDAELATAKTGVDVGGEPHTITPRRVGGRTELWACSSFCGPLTGKIEGFLNSPHLDPTLRPQVEALQTRIRELEARIGRGELSSADVVAETNAISAELTRVGRSHPELASALEIDTRLSPAEQADIGRAWGVGTDGRFTGTVDVGGRTMTPAEIHDEAVRNARRVGADPNVRQPGEPDIVFRWRRHRATGVQNTKPSEFGAWAESGARIHTNQAKSRPVEAAGRGMVGARDNNAAGGAEVPGRPFSDVDYTERVHGSGQRLDQQGARPKGSHTVAVDTRPDGLRPNPRGGYDVVEHKHLSAGEVAGGVLHDTRQMRAQRAVAAANDGTHELIISSDAGAASGGRIGAPPVRPSGPLGRSGSTIYFYDPRIRQVTHVWSPQANGGRGGWQPLVSGVP